MDKWICISSLFCFALIGNSLGCAQEPSDAEPSTLSLCGVTLKVMSSSETIESRIVSRNIAPDSILPIMWEHKTVKHSFWIGLIFEGDTPYTVWEGDYENLIVRPINPEPMYRGYVRIKFRNAFEIVDSACFMDDVVLLCNSYPQFILLVLSREVPDQYRMDEVELKDFPLREFIPEKTGARQALIRRVADTNDLFDVAMVPIRGQGSPSNDVTKHEISRWRVRIRNGDVEVLKPPRSYPVECVSREIAAMDAKAPSTIAARETVQRVMGACSYNVMVASIRDFLNVCSEQERAKLFYLLFSEMERSGSDSQVEAIINNAPTGIYHDVNLVLGRCAWGMEQVLDWNHRMILGIPSAEDFLSTKEVLAVTSDATPEELKEVLDRCARTYYREVRERVKERLPDMTQYNADELLEQARHPIPEICPVEVDAILDLLGSTFTSVEVAQAVLESKWTDPEVVLNMGLSGPTNIDRIYQVQKHQPLQSSAEIDRPRPPGW